MKKLFAVLMCLMLVIAYMPSFAFADVVLGNSDSQNAVVSDDNEEAKPGDDNEETKPGGDNDNQGGNASYGGGGTVILPEVVKNTAGTTTADITTTVKDGKATTAVDAATAGKIVEKAIANKSETIIINAVTNKADIKTAEVSLPADTVKSIAEKTTATVIVKTDIGDVAMDKAAVDAVAQSAAAGEVKLVINTVKADENRIVLELSIITSTGAVTDFKGGNVKVTVKLSNELKTKNPVCVYIDDNGIYTKVDGVLNADGTFTFTTGHFSTYAIMAKEEADKTMNEQLKTLIKDVKIKARTAKTSKKNVKVTVKADVSAITALDYTVKYKFYKSTKKASKYTAVKTKDTNTYINTKGKKGTKYYYKAKVLVYDGDKLVGQTVLKQCKYGVRTWSK